MYFPKTADELLNQTNPRLKSVEKPWYRAWLEKKRKSESFKRPIPKLDLSGITSSVST